MTPEPRRLDDKTHRAYDGVRLARRSGIISTSTAAGRRPGTLQTPVLIHTTTRT